MLPTTVVIWSKEGCPYCEGAKLLCDDYRLDFIEKVIDGEQYTKQDLQKVVPDAKTVPQIFYDGTHIGGYREFKEFLAKRDR